MKNPLFRRPYWKKTNRGGSCDDPAWVAPVSRRSRFNASEDDFILGFRVFRSQEKS